jgi:ribosomal protein S18 acetylase RimI-like enzyme
MEVETMLTRPITVREATLEDIPFMRKMIWEAILASPIFLAQVGVEKLQQLEDEYWSAWRDRSDPAFVAIDASGQKLGAISVKPNDKGKPVSGWRIGIGVEAHARGQRVGQYLLERVIAFAKENGARYVNLFVDSTNTPAITLYRRVGFVEVSEKTGLIEMNIRFDG